MRFRLLRSRAFWFGVPGLVFLLWAWGVSLTHHTGIWMMGTTGAGIIQAGGEVILRWHSKGPPMPQIPSAFHEKKDAESMRRVKRYMLESKTNNPDVRGGSIPHHALVLGYVLAWIGLVAWRARKYRALPLGTGGE